MSSTRTPLEVSSSDIDRLDERGLVDTVNFMLREEAIRCAIPLSALTLSANEKAPDEGIDAKITDVTAASEWIPLGGSVWQFKAYDLTPSAIKNELTDPKHAALQALLQGGANYVLVIGCDPGTKLAKREQAIAEGLRAISATGTGRLIASPTLAVWASRLPALLLRPQFSHAGAELMNHEEWAGAQLHRGAFIPTADQVRVIGGVSDELRGVHHGSRRLRLTGLSGIGKTRAVLEATRPDEIRGRVIYASNPNHVPQGLLAWLRRTPGASAIVIVDNCDSESRSLIEQALSFDAPTIYLVTIGPDSSIPLADEGIYNLERMSFDDMKKVIEAVFPGMQLETQMLVTRLASGFVKAAIMLGRYFHGRPAHHPPAVAAASEDIKQFLEALIGDDPDGQLRLALSALSLFTEVGVEDGLEGELASVAQFLGIELRSAKRMIERARAGEIVESVGRRRRVTPEILAIVLAAEQWGAQASDLVHFYDSLPDVELRRRFLRRLGSLGQDERTSRVVAELLGSAKVFSNLEDLNSKERAELLLYLASAHPGAGLAALEQLLGAAGVEDLRKLNGGRRAVVATLERLVWLPSTFEGAATLLLDLAEAENEKYANNSTGVWNQLFRPLLSGSAVPAIDRLDFLEGVLSSPELGVEKRRLALRALGNVFETHVSRSVVMDSLGGRPLPPEWRPTTQHELFEAFEAAFNMLERVAMNASSDLRATALEELLSNTRTLFAQGLGERVLASYGALTPTADTELRAAIAKELNGLLAYDTDRMPAGLAAQAKQMQDGLLGRDLDVKVRRYLGKPGPGDFTDDLNHPSHAQEQSVHLAEEAWCDRPALERNWVWLSSPEAQRSWWFFVRLGELDASTEFLERLEQRLAPDRSTAPVFQWSAMLEGMRRTERATEAWQHLERLANSQATGWCVLEALWRSEPGEQAAELMAQMISGDTVEPEELGRLVYGNWIGKVSVEAGSNLVRALLAKHSDKADETALHLLGMRLGVHKEEDARFQSLVWEVLARTVTGTQDTMSSHHWMVLAKPLLGADPGRIAGLVVLVFQGDEYISGSDPRLEILREAIRLAPSAVWAALSKALLGENIKVYALRNALRGRVLDGIAVSTVMAWVREHGEASAVAVMYLSGVGPVLSQLQRRLLTEFPESKDLRSALLSNMYTGTFSGEHHHWLEERLAWVRSWAKDKEPVIRRWASSLVPGLEQEIVRTKLREEEEGY